jgi:cell wall-associated NlpC family hydrolase
VPTRRIRRNCVLRVSRPPSNASRTARFGLEPERRTADTPGRMLLRRLALPSAVVVAAAVAGCGATRDDRHTGTPVAAVRAWDVPAPYLPPPDPSSLARRTAAPTPAEPATDPVAAAQTPAHRAAAPRRPGPGGAASGAPSDAQVAADLRQAYGGKAGADLDQAAIDSAGYAIIPPTAPAKLVALMQGANEVARKPYVYGGGHGRNPNEIWTDSAYDCSGSVSYALAAAGYLDGPVDSTTLMSFGQPGPGTWVTIFANGGHTFMVVAGLRFDTSGRQVTGTRWQSANARSYAGFAVRHPIGL